MYHLIAVSILCYLIYPGSIYSLTDGMVLPIYARLLWAMGSLPMLLLQGSIKIQFSNACRFHCFLKVFSGDPYVVRRHRAPARPTNRTRTRDKLSLQHIRSTAESVKYPKSYLDFAIVVFCYHSRYLRIPPPP